ncbi:MAG: DNA repair protein RadC [Gammaproteobacteria bacterium]|nr:DNA repair protein RadC [Gammaproteobacteria bacterium]
MTIKDWPATERPRERLLDCGAGALSDAELLAILLRTGPRGSTAVDRARELLALFGGLRLLLEAEPGAFCAARGSGVATYVQLQAALELTRRYLLCRISRGRALGSPAEVRQFLQLKMRYLAHEVFACLFLDNQHTVICYEELFRGTIDGASVYPREIVKRALALNAAAVIFAHNHPSGVAEPSQADQRLTQRLKAALGTVDIRVLDHFVVGEADALSFAERGLL